MPYDDRRKCRIVFLGLVSAASFAIFPAMAASQSSNSSSNCSGGRCSRVDSLVIESDRGQIRSWQRLQTWDERRHWNRVRPDRDD